MNSFPLFPNIFKFHLILALFLATLTACTTSDSGTKEASGLNFSFATIRDSWIKTNSKYSELANGPLAGEIGASLSGAAKKQALKAEYSALENSKSGEAILWQYSATQNGKITPYPPYQVGSSNCRRYVHSVSVNGATRQAAGTACRDKNGNWTPLT